jgi:hypothetical protein
VTASSGDVRRARSGASAFALSCRTVGMHAGDVSLLQSYLAAAAIFAAN